MRIDLDNSGGKPVENPKLRDLLNKLVIFAIYQNISLILKNKHEFKSQIFQSLTGFTLRLLILGFDTSCHTPKAIENRIDLATDLFDTIVLMKDLKDHKMFLE